MKEIVYQPVAMVMRRYATIMKVPVKAIL